jgi:thymidine phosphorylase
MRLGAGRATKGEAIDPAVGVVLSRPAGAAVHAGESLATIHGRTDDAARAAVREVAAAITIGEAAPPAERVILDVVG